MTNSIEGQLDGEVFIVTNEGFGLPAYLGEYPKSETLPLPLRSDLGRNMFEILRSSEGEWGVGSNIVPLESEAVDEDKEK